MATSIEILKSYFEAGAKPTEQQFHELIDSFLHRDDDLNLLAPMAEINEAEQGTATDRYMSPFLVFKAIVALTRLSNIPGLESEINSLLTILSNSFNLALSNHLNNHANPHNVTKSQVGLGNLPNAKSDSLQLNDTNTLATAKAIHDLNQNKANITHNHQGLHFAGNLRALAENNAVDFYRPARMLPETYGGLTTIVFRPFFDQTHSQVFAGREQDTESFFIRVDTSDPNPNWQGYFEFKANGDIMLSSIDCRIRDRVTGTVIGSTSDKRLKRKITDIKESVIDKILKLRPVQFLFKNHIDDNKKKNADRLGFISQEVEKLFPNLVDTSDKGFKSIDYAKMSVILTKAVQEQQLAIETLTKRIESLEKRLNSV